MLHEERVVRLVFIGFTADPHFYLSLLVFSNKPFCDSERPIDHDKSFDSNNSSHDMFTIPLPFLKRYHSISIDTNLLLFNFLMILIFLFLSISMYQLVQMSTANIRMFIIDSSRDELDFIFYL